MVGKLRWAIFVDGLERTRPRRVGGSAGPMTGERVMAKPMSVTPVDVARLDQAFFAPCEVCQESPRNRTMLVRLGACPSACDHMRAVQQRLRRIRQDYSSQPGA